MKFELSDQEYRELLDLVHIADVVLSGHRREEDARTAAHRALIQKLYSLAQGEGLNGLFGFNADARKYVPTPEFETSTLAHRAIDEFGNHLFWDELISRLTTRDMAQMAGGMERLRVISGQDRQRLEEPVRQRYVQEFSANGVSNLEVVERPGSVWNAPAATSD
jgi:hypothetical protein